METKDSPPVSPAWGGAVTSTEMSQTLWLHFSCLTSPCGNRRAGGREGFAVGAGTHTAFVCVYYSPPATAAILGAEDGEANALMEFWISSRRAEASTERF